MKKIAIVTYSLRMGGLESVIFNLGKSFINKGFEVEIIETLEEGIWKNYFIENGFKVVSIVKNSYMSAITHSKKIALYLNKFDIILLNDAPYAQSGLGKIKEDALIFPIVHLALQSMAFNASGNKGQWNKIITVSPLLKKFMLDQIENLSDQDVICIPNGIDTKEFSPEKKLNLNKKKILYLGRISEEKGVRLLPEIINKIKDNNNFDILDVYGSGPLEQELTLSIEKFDLLSKINMMGAIAHESVSNIMRHYDILLMPSYNEGHPIVLLEAMASGIVPVVSRLVGATDIVVLHSENGYLCEPGNIEQFALYLNQALEKNDLTKMAEQARETIEKKYNINIMSNEYLTLFKIFSGSKTSRTGKIEKLLLGDLPFLSYILVRPLRKILRLLRLWKKN